VTDRPVRSDAIDISPVDDGYVVYDSDGDLVHYLNHTAAVTLELCDGRRTVAEITTFLEEMFSGAGDVRECVISCIDQLRDLGLVLPSVSSRPLSG
jgi:Coenzyme PQQ synthesis protein D (PqqD)